MAQILLIEDDLEICEILQFYLLKQPSYGVTVAHSAKEALVLMPLRRYDLILLDIMLPDQDGVSLCQELRRYALPRSGTVPSVFCAGALRLDTTLHTATKGGTPVLLSPTEYELLCYFMQHPGRFIPFDELYNAVWQRPSMGDLRTLFVHIAHLRQKIEDDSSRPEYIRTHMRDGYIFSTP